MELLAEAASFKRIAWAESTKSAYRTHLNTFLRFCIFFGRKPIPADQVTLMAYVAFLARTLKPGSINCYINVVRIMHLEAGMPNPLKENFEIGLIRRGVARRLGVPPNQKLPLTASILLQMRAFLDLSLSCDMAFWAACLLGFYGLMRKSTLLPKSEINAENCVLRGDVLNMCEDSFVLRVRHSKTIQFGQRELQIPFVFCDLASMCPVKALLLHLVTSSLSASVPLFTYSEKGRSVSLTHSVFVSRLRACLRRCGVNPMLYSGHSFRRGGCTMSYEAGLSLVDIKMRGDWRSSAFERYVHVPVENIFPAARSMSECVSKQCST
jgi:hypothetical protein